jgi:hypothetical protein
MPGQPTAVCARHQREDLMAEDRSLIPATRMTPPAATKVAPRKIPLHFVSDQLFPKSHSGCAIGNVGPRSSKMTRVGTQRSGV